MCCVAHKKTCVCLFCCLDLLKHLKLKNMIALEDLKDMSNEDVIKHLITSYAGTESGFSYGEIKDDDIEKAKEQLKDMEVLIAYEHVGSWGCDSSSFFLLKNKQTNELFEVHGSHCSCYGFEGQLELEPTTAVELKYRAEKANGVFFCGGYDENEEQNQKTVNDFILSL